MADLCWGNPTVFHLVAVTKLWASEIQVPIGALSIKNSSTSTQQRESEWDPSLLPNLAHEYFSLLLPQKAIKQTQHISESFNFEKTPPFFGELQCSETFLITLPKCFGLLEWHCYNNATFHVDFL